MHFLFKMVRNDDMLYRHCFTIYHQDGPRKSEALALNGTHKLLVYADNVHMSGENIKIP
jgi:hypothetical protein